MSWLDNFMGAKSAAPINKGPDQQSGLPAQKPFVPANKSSEGGESQEQNSPTAQTKEGPTDPLAAFSKMYDNAVTSEKAPAFDLDPKQLTEVAKNRNFMQGIDSELMAKATNGDSAALLEVMHLSNKNAYQAALSDGSRLTGSFVDARDAFSSKGFGKKVKGELVNAEIRSKDFKSPVVTDQLRRTAEALQNQHPDASASEIRQMTMDYFIGIAQAINPAAPQTPAASKEYPTDFNDWFDK